MTEKLRHITEKIHQCRKCPLCDNDKTLPYIGEYAKNIFLLDFIRHDAHDYMDKLWKLFKEVGLSKQEFIVIYTTQCMTKPTKRGGKIHTSPPAKIHREKCKLWLNEFVHALDKPKMLIMGNVAMEHVTNQFSGIVELNATTIKPKIEGVIVPCVLSVSPSYLKEWGEGYYMVKKSLEVFKHL